MLRGLFFGVAVSSVVAFPQESCLASGSAQSIAAGHDLSGKTVFMTGGDSGIGYEAAIALAHVNATIIISNHNAAKGQAAVENITRLTGNTKVEAFSIDLTSFKSVRALAASVLAKHPVLDIVLFDAGMMGLEGDLPLTEDGFEPIMQVNYISHFLLEQLLLPSLRASRGKLIHVSSGFSYEATLLAGMFGHGIDDAAVLDSLVRTRAKKYRSNYGIAKLMDIFNARELAEREAARGSGVRAYSVRPGLASTHLTHDMPSLFAKAMCSWPLCAAGKTRDGQCQAPCPVPAPAAACSPTYVAVTDLPPSQDGSLFFQCEVEAGPAWGTAEQQKLNQQRLYDMSLKWTGSAVADVLV